MVSPRGCNSNHSSLWGSACDMSQLSLVWSVCPAAGWRSKMQPAMTSEKIGMTELVEGNFAGTPWNTHIWGKKKHEKRWFPVDFRKTKPLVNIKKTRSISSMDLAKKHVYYLLNALQKLTYARTWGNLFVKATPRNHLTRLVVWSNPHHAPPLVAKTGQVWFHRSSFTSVSPMIQVIQGLEWRTCLFPC